MITKQQLMEIGTLKREIELDQRRLKMLKNRSLTPTFSTGVRDSDAPDVTGRLAGMLADLENEILKKSERCVALLLKLQKFISEVESSEQRTVLYLRYVKCSSWQSIANALGEYDEQLPRKRHRRFLREQGIE